MRQIGMMASAALALATIGSPHAATAAVAYGTAGSTLTETFGDLTGPTNNTVVTWANNSTIPNWYADVTQIQYAYGGGVSSTGRLYAFKFDANGNINSPAGALGSRTTGASNVPVSYAWEVVNTTGQTLDSFDLAYDAFVAHDQAKTADKLAFSYKLGGAFGDAGYTGIAALDYVVTDNDTAAESGNPVAAYSANVSNSGNTLEWLPGQTLWLRWTDLSNAYSSEASMGMGIDNVKLTATAVPEPGTLSLLGIAGLAALRRRR